MLWAPPVCGNGVCELDERCDSLTSPSASCCLADCHIVFASASAQCSMVLVPVLLTFGSDACVACPVGPRGTPCNGAGTCISGVNGQGQCQCFPESGFMGTRRGSSGGVSGTSVVSPAVWLLRPQATTVVPADPAGRPGAHQVAARTSAKATSSSHCHSPRSSLVPASPVASRRGWALCCSVLVPWSGCACWCSS